jgi:hypothetical protein
VLGVEYLRHRGVYRSAVAARRKVSELYRVEADAMKKWPTALKRGLGAKRFDEECAIAAISGYVVRIAEREGWSLPRGFAETGEQLFGLAALKADGVCFYRLQYPQKD